MRIHGLSGNRTGQAIRLVTDGQLTVDIQMALQIQRAVEGQWRDGRKVIVVQEVADAVGRIAAHRIDQKVTDRVQRMRHQFQTGGVLHDLKINIVIGLHQTGSGSEFTADRTEGHELEHFAIERFETVPQTDFELAVQVCQIRHVDLVVTRARIQAAQLDLQRCARCLGVGVDVLHAGRVARRQHAGVQQRDVVRAAAHQRVVHRDGQFTVHEAVALGQVSDVEGMMIDCEFRSRGRCGNHLIDQCVADRSVFQHANLPRQIRVHCNVVVVYVIRQHQMRRSQNRIGRKQYAGF